MGVTDGVRPRLRLVEGGAAVEDPTALARRWHPSQGGRPPRIALIGGTGAVRARQRWGGGGGTVSEPSIISPIDKTIGMLIDVAAWR